MTIALPPWLLPLQARFAAALAADQLGHAVLIAGEAGLGKRVLVQAMAARLLCQAPSAADPCGRCRGCTWFAAGSHPDLVRVVPAEDSAVIKVDQVRALIGRMQLTGQAGPTRVAVIDPADAMNAAAQNALLKTLEEPPAGVHLLLVADAPSRLLATVRSRTQAYSVSSPATATVQDWLIRQQGRSDGAALHLALTLAGGHPGAALAYADEERRQAAGAVAADLCRLAEGNQAAWLVARRWSEAPEQSIVDAAAWLRLWSWRDGGVEVLASAIPGPALPPVLVADAYAGALRLRERLRAPLKPTWLLLEWLGSWQQSAARARAEARSA